MRKQFVTTVEQLLKSDNRAALLLGDMGVWGFNRAFKEFPDRVYNIGILEQSTIGVAAGLAMNGLIPIVHTIAPFLVERSYEQLKLDFGYQKLGGNFVSVGASFDYAALGCTHHCPGDVGVLKNIPGMEIVLPGTSKEFDTLFKESYADGNPTYYRLSEKENKDEHEVRFGKAEVIKKGREATVVVVGPMLDQVMEACADLDVSILYYTTVAPFDRDTLVANSASGKILLCEPYYFGGLASEVLSCFPAKPIVLDFVGVPHKFLTKYGKREELEKEIGFTAENIRQKANQLVNLKV